MRWYLTRRIGSPNSGGEIDRAKKVRVLGSETDHLVALLHTDEGGWIAVDVGPTDTLRGIRIKTGDWIAPQEPISTIGRARSVQI